jgi:hypothetical protein
MSESGPPRPAQPDSAKRQAPRPYEAALKQAHDALAQSRDLAEYYDNLLKLAALESGPKTREEEERQWRAAGTPAAPPIVGWRGALKRGCVFGLPFFLGPPTMLLIGELAFRRDLHILKPEAAADITMIVMFVFAPAAFLIGMLTAKD